jgi:hypothetical protein
MSDSKIKYLKILKEQYNKGYISKKQYQKELRNSRGEKNAIEFIMGLPIVAFITTITNKLARNFSYKFIYK